MDDDTKSLSTIPPTDPASHDVAWNKMNGKEWRERGDGAVEMEWVGQEMERVMG